MFCKVQWNTVVNYWTWEDNRKPQICSQQNRSAGDLVSEVEGSLVRDYPELVKFTKLRQVGVRIVLCTVCYFQDVVASASLSLFLCGIPCSVEISCHVVNSPRKSSTVRNWDLQPAVMWGRLLELNPPPSVKTLDDYSPDWHFCYNFAWDPR